MDLEAFNILTSDRIQGILEENLEADPAQFALTYRTNGFPTALVSTQLKYLQRARSKLPTYYVSRCLIPPRAYEQASSEATASLKPRPTGRVLDLSCGLGVDTAHFARTAEAVVSLEPDPELHRVTRYNLDRLGFEAVELHCQRAEDFVASYTGPPFDLIYVDPSRRGAKGERIHDLVEGQPAIPQLLPQLRKMGKKLLIKAAPAYDLQAGRRVLPDLERITVVSLRNEVKEVWFEIDLSGTPLQPASLEIRAARLEGLHVRELGDLQATWQAQMPSLEEEQYLLEADVAYYKAQRLDTWLNDQIRGQHPLGFLWAAELPEAFPGRVFRVREVWPYQPKALKRALKARGIKRAHISRRAFPLSVQAVRSRLRLLDGGDEYLLLTSWNGQKIVARCALV